MHSKLKQRKKYSFDHKITKLEGSDQTIYLVIIEFPLNKTELNSLLNKKSLGAESFSLTEAFDFFYATPKIIDIFKLIVTCTKE